MAVYHWTNIGQIIVVLFWFLALLLWTISGPKLDYCAYEDDTEELLTNDAARIACEAEAALGNKGCVKDFYVSRGWKTFEWYVLYFPITIAVLELFFVAMYLMFQHYGITWFLMVIPLALGFVWLTVAIVATAIYWTDCAKHDFCSNAKFAYDFTDTVSQKTAWAWIVHMVALYVMWLAHLGFFVVSIANQAALSRAVAESVTHERADFLNPLFKPNDRKRIREANAMGSGSDSLISTSIGSSTSSSPARSLGPMDEFTRKTD